MHRHIVKAVGRERKDPRCYRGKEQDPAGRSLVNILVEIFCCSRLSLQKLAGDWYLLFASWAQPRRGRADAGSCQFTVRLTSDILYRGKGTSKTPPSTTLILITRIADFCFLISPSVMPDIKLIQAQDSFPSSSSTPLKLVNAQKAWNVRVSPAVVSSRYLFPESMDVELTSRKGPRTLFG